MRAQTVAENFQNPDYMCNRCPRLCAFLAENRVKFPDKYNGPVESFGPLTAELLIIGLAPGLRGANFSGRPFTGDFAGDVLYSTLIKYGLATGTYAGHRDDGIALVNTRITNGVRCVPPENKPTPEEVNNCRDFLVSEMKAMPNLRVILTLGQISHTTTLKTLGVQASRYKFAHGAVHRLDTGLLVVNTYHSSRYNVNTGRLTTPMFHSVFDKVAALLKG